MPREPRRRWGRINPRWRALDAIRDSEAHHGVPFGDQRLPRQRNENGNPIEPPYANEGYWTKRRFFFGKKRRPR